MKEAILRRPLTEFQGNLEFAWYGDCRVVVESHGVAIYDLPLCSAGLRAVNEAMSQEKDRMHKSCLAFC